jgi:hypothetical protein
MDIPGSATATAETAVKKGMAKRASLISFIVNRRYKTVFGSDSYLDVKLVLMAGVFQNQNTGDDSNPLFIFDCSVKLSSPLEVQQQQPVIYLNPASSSPSLALQLHHGLQHYQFLLPILRKSVYWL